ncbi:hypothetical protein [Streptomyces misionensis]|uniref:hypothetical protein n=1 Tax=Streptomyces misionensis TaxID=67331 RepID=UPI000A4CBAA9|nr:hypothetical protein [Streptomyces misionensis]
MLEGVPSRRLPRTSPAGEGPAALPGYFGATEEHVDGKTPVDSGGDQEEQEAAERRRERRKLVVQLLVDWSPVLAGLANLVVQHFS